MKMDKIKPELDKISRKHGDRLSPADVVDYARRNKRSELHKSFDEQGLWDDSTAAERARRTYGRQVIQSYKIVLEHQTVSHKVRAYVSLTTERGEQPSYQLRSEVMKTSLKRASFEIDVSRELRSIAERFVDVLSDEERAAILEVAASVEDRGRDRLENAG